MRNHEAEDALQMERESLHIGKALGSWILIGTTGSDDLLENSAAIHAK
jgi:hypothetical protein